VNPNQQDVESLFRDHGTAILRYFARRVDPVEDAADLMSDVMLAAWRRRDTIPPQPQNVLWLYGVARNVLANHRRGTRRRTAATQHLADQLHSAPTNTQAPSDEILDVRAAIRSLSEPDREILTLSAWEGLTSAEIAAIVGLPPSTVRARLARSRAAIRSLTATETTA